MAVTEFAPVQNTRLFVDSGTVWATVRDDSDSDGIQTGGISNATFDTPDYQISRIGLSFNTASIPDDDTVTAVIIKVYPTSLDSNTNTVDLDAVSFAPSDPTSHVVGDYVKAKWGTSQFGVITYATLGSNLNTLNSINLDANGIDEINKTGHTSYGLRCSRDTDDSAPTGANRVVFTAANTALFVTHSAPSGFFAIL